MTDTEIMELVLIVQSMEREGIFVKDHDILDAVELVKFNRIVDNDIMMNKLMEEQK